MTPPRPDRYIQRGMAHDTQRRQEPATVWISRTPQEQELMKKQPSYRGQYPDIVTDPQGSELGIEILGLSEPYGFAWGYEGTGPRLLAKAILLDHTGDEALSRRDAKDFMLACTSHLGSPYHSGRSWELPVEEVSRWVASRPPVQPDREPFWDWVISLPVTNDPKGRFVREAMASNPRAREAVLASAGSEAKEVYHRLLEEWSWVSEIDEVRARVVEEHES